MEKINFGNKLRGSQCSKYHPNPPLSHPMANPGPTYVHPWHVILIGIQGLPRRGQGMAIAVRESTWNQADVLLLVVQRSNKCISSIELQKALQMNVSTWQSVEKYVLQTIWHAILRAGGGAGAMKSDLSHLFFVLWSQGSTHWKERKIFIFSLRLIT